MRITMKVYTIGEKYYLAVDGEDVLIAKKGELRKILYEMEKYMRLRFKGELQHTPLKDFTNKEKKHG